MIRRTLLALTLLACLGSDLSARDFYVNNLIGDDRHDGGTPELVSDRVGPMRSITRALKAAQPGDRIIVTNTGRAYRECLTLQGRRHGSDGSRNFQIIGNGSVIDGRVPVDAQAWRHDFGEVFSFSRTSRAA
ncbi:MAG: hypothetical protein R3B96_14390 [Pirellulaceae bacterium]